MYNVLYQVITVTLALIFAAKYIFENDYVRSSTKTIQNSELFDGTLKNGTLKNGLVKKGSFNHLNGNLSRVESDPDSMTISRKALFTIGEGLQEKVSALVSSAAMAAKSATLDNVRVNFSTSTLKCKHLLNFYLVNMFY